MTTSRKLVLTSRLVLFGLLAGTIALTLSCSDRSALSVDGQSSVTVIDSLAKSVDLLSCTPLAYDSTSQDIGPLGGTIRVGPHTFVVPAGALDSTVTITAVAPSDSVNQVRFQPDGLQFNTPASLTLSYANCNTLGALLPKRVAHVSDALLILDFLQSVNHPFSQSVTGRVNHFSGYAVAW